MNVPDDIRQDAGVRIAIAPRDPRALFDVLKRETATTLADMFDGFFDAVGEQARLAWLANTGSRARAQDREMADALRDRADRFLDLYRQRIVAGFDAWLRMESAEAEARRLSLMSDSQLQMQLMAQAVGDELMRHVGVTLVTLEGRMANLALALGASRQVPVPLRPSTVVNAFITSFRSDDLSVELQTTVFRQFERRLVPTLSLLYARLNSRLSDAGYPAQLADAAKPRPFDAIDDLPRPPATWEPDGGVVECRRPETVAADAGPAPRLDPAPTIRSVAGMPMRYRDLVRDRLRAWREGAGVAANDTQSIGTVLGAEELASVAALLQGDDADAITRVLSGRDRQPLAKVLRDAVSDGARQLGLSRGATRFAPDEEDAIDLVAMLFQSLAETSAAAQTRPELYARLVMPYLRLALVDDSLFNRRTHPARRLLDALIEVCDDDADEDTGEALDLATRVVERVTAGFREDLEIFELATDELQQFQEQQRRRAALAERRAAEAMHGRERLRQAREASHASLANLLQRGALTEAFAAFLRDPWRYALDQAWLRDGHDSERWRALVALGDALVALDADAARPEQGDLVERWLQLEPQIAACCDVAGPDAAATRQTIARMVFAMAHPDAERTPHQAPVDEADEDPQASAQGLLRLVAGKDGVEHDPAIATRMRRLRVGQALQLFDEGGRAVFGRVAWISPLTGRLLIVNRRGMRKLVASPEQLAALVGAGRVTLRSSQAPSDLAIKRLWYQLNAAQAQAEPLAETA